MYFNKELVDKFTNTDEFCDGDINKFLLLRRKEFTLKIYE